MGGYNITQLGFNTGRFGCGYFFADPDLAGSIDELRIYAGVLTASDVANTFNAGPNALVAPGSTPQITISISISGGHPVLSWPLGTLEQADEIIGPWISLSSATSPYTPTPSGAKRFFRVRLN